MKSLRITFKVFDQICKDAGEQTVAQYLKDRFDAEVSPNLKVVMFKTDAQKMFFKLVYA